jgi:hypothetical protein
MQPRLDRATHAGYQRAVPPASSDRTLLLVTGSTVALAALLVGALLFFATGGAQGTPTPKPVYIGLESDLRATLNQGPRLYFAHPFGGTGFWLDVEDGHLVALVARLPGTQSCTVAWRNLSRGYFDCHDRELSARQLNRYALQFPRVGPQQGGVIVDFRHVDPSPQAPPR